MMGSASQAVDVLWRAIGWIERDSLKEGVCPIMPDYTLADGGTRFLSGDALCQAIAFKGRESERGSAPDHV